MCIYVSIYLSTYLPIYLSIYLSINQSIYLSIYLSTFLSILNCVYTASIFLSFFSIYIFLFTNPSKFFYICFYPTCKFLSCSSTMTRPLCMWKVTAGALERPRPLEALARLPATGQKRKMQTGGAYYPRSSFEESFNKNKNVHRAHGKHWPIIRT